jgi:hypothetical protein
MYSNKKFFTFAIITISLSFFSCVSSRKDSVSMINTGANEKNTTSVTESTSDLENSDDAVKNGKKITVVSTEKDPSKGEEINGTALLPIDEYKIKTRDITISSVSAPSEIENGKNFVEPFVYKALDKNKNPVENIVLTISYPSFSENGNVAFASEDIITNEKGEISFNAPYPEFSCDSFVSCYIKPDKLDTTVSLYIKDVAIKSSYKVHTSKVWASYSISMLDYTADGNPIKTNSLTSSAILQGMYKRGLHSVSNSDWINEIETGNNKLLYSHANKLFHDSINYLIHGKVTYIKPVTTNNDGYKTTAWHIEYSVMDMKTGKDIIFDSFDVTGEASSDWELFDTIRREKIAPVIANAIYYGL